MHACKESLDGVLQYQILEKAPESIVWRLLLAQDADLEEISSELVECSRAAIGPEADISVEAVNRILPLDGLKLTRIVRIQSRENGRGSRNDTPR